MTPAEFRTARIELGLTQAQLARLLGVSPRAVKQWEAERGSNARTPNPIASRALEWFGQGFRPTDWPQ